MMRHLAVLLVTLAAAIPTAAQEGVSLEEFLIPLPYGGEESVARIHCFMNTALWNFDEQAWGSYANASGSYSGRPTFISYSGYINVGCQIARSLFAEAEFELYKGETGSFKVCKLRQVWTPSQYFQLSLGRDFPPIGVQDKVYYPPSRYRLLAMAPYLYWSVLRATGWWDSGIHLTFNFPTPSLMPNSVLHANLAVINGPGDQHQTGDYLVEHMRPNGDGYMYEGFHNKARQPWDNNESKHICGRVSMELAPGFEFGGSYADGKYDKDDEYGAAYLFAHCLYAGPRLTIAAEYGQLKVEGTDSNMANVGVNDENGTWLDTELTQMSYYLSAGYKVLKGEEDQYLEPVIRYEFMDSWVEDETNIGDRQLIWVGLRASPIKYWTLKAGYAFQSEPDGPELENNGMLLESVVEF